METTPYRGRLARAGLTSFHPEMLAAEAFRREIAQWFYAATHCRFDIALNDSPDRDTQRGFLSSLIAWGEWAQTQVSEKQIDLSSIGVSLDDVAAETRLLRDTYRSAFDNSFSRKEADDVLASVFG